MSLFPKAVGGRLRGKSIILSASVPTPERAEQYQRVEDSHFEIDQAVISLARAVFSESGQLVFGGQPDISSLVAMVAGEYREPRFAESNMESPIAPISIFQSRAFEGFLPQETLLMYQLGYATITWIDAVDNERFDPRVKGLQCPRSLHAMREAMIRSTNPEAMVCIGGMEGVETEAEMFRELRSKTPLYALCLTGGASLILTQKRKDIRVIDSEVVARIRRFTDEFPHHKSKGIAMKDDERTVVPYPLIMQTIVDELVGEIGESR